MYPTQKFAAELPQFGVWKDGFSEEEVEKIIFLEKLLEFSKGQVGVVQNVDLSARDSDISFLQHDENTHWIFERIAAIVPRVNYDLFLFDIEGIEAIQYTRYREDQYYDWHLDSHSVWLNFERKISGVVFLDDPEDYEGGELEVITGGNPNNSQLIKPAKGQIAFFASNMPHRARPVTKGVRRSLVFWVQGRRTM